MDYKETKHTEIEEKTAYDESICYNMDFWEDGACPCEYDNLKCRFHVWNMWEHDVLPPKTCKYAKALAEAGYDTKLTLITVPDDTTMVTYGCRVKWIKDPNTDWLNE
jgi:hypothetical protein